MCQWVCVSAAETSNSEFEQSAASGSGEAFKEAWGSASGQTDHKCSRLYYALIKDPGGLVYNENTDTGMTGRETIAVLRPLRIRIS